MVPEIILTALQFINSDCMEQTTGNFMTATDDSVQLKLCDEPFEGHVSFIVRLPLNRNVRFSIGGSAEGLGAGG